MSDRGFLISVEGPTGVGKTTLAQKLAGSLGADLSLDPFEGNPFLPQLLAAPTERFRVALCTELVFIGLRVAQLRNVAKALDAGRVVVCDWAFIKQSIFARTTLGDADASRIADTTAVWTRELRGPDLLIGMSAPVEVLQTRIAGRGRAGEAGITDAELAALSFDFESAYIDFDGAFIHIEASFDVHDTKQLSTLCARVRRRISRKDHRNESVFPASRTGHHDRAAGYSIDDHRPREGRVDQ